MSNEIKLKDFVLQEVGQENNELGDCIVNYLKSSNTSLTTNELKQFVMLCKINNLNPLLNEIYAIKYKVHNKETKEYEEKLQVITNYYEYVKRARLTGDVDYYYVDVIYKDENRTQISHAIFHGKRKSDSKEMTMEFPFNEWKPSFQSKVWDSKPHFMIEKVALANGLRRLFPCELEKLPYTQEEDWNNPADRVINKQAKLDKKAEEKAKELEAKEIEIAKVLG